MENEINYNLQKVEDNFAYDAYEKPKRAWWKILIFFVLGILILGGVGYVGYWGYNKYFGNTPEQVLMKSFEKMKEVGAFEYEGKTSVNIPMDQDNMPAGSLGLFESFFSGKELVLDTVFVGAYDHIDSNNPKSKLDIDLSAGDMFTFGVRVVSANDKVYFNFNKIPAMLAMFVDSSGIKNQWIEYEQDKPLEIGLDLPKINQDEDEIKKISEVIDNNIYKIIIIKADLGVEELSDVEGKVYHYKLGLDKDGVVKLIEDIKLVVDEERKKNIENSFTNITDEDWKKIVQEEADVWIGKKDYYIKKIVYNTTYKNPLDKIGIKNHDAQRISDIKQIQTALELYFTDANSYPIAKEPIVLGQGQNKSLSFSEGEDIALSGFNNNNEHGFNNANIYFANVPSDPAGGEYVYQSFDGSNYTIDFVVEADINGLKAGSIEANPHGLAQISIFESNFTETTDDKKTEIKFRLGVLFKNFNNVTAIETPENPVNLETFISDVMGGLAGTALNDAQQKSRDAKRISDIKQIQTALEMYFNDQNSYPVVDEEIILGDAGMPVLCDKGFEATVANCGITYMLKIPTNPEPGGHAYTYRSIDNGSDYAIVFVLENATGGFKAGMLEANNAGIKQLNETMFQDSDNDLLSDEDEINIWGTDPLNQDTDGDGYLDGQEVQNGYNPNGEGKME